MPKVPRKRDYHHGDLRNALIAASLEAIAEGGVEGFTLREAARRAGVSPAAPYRHFESRDDLLAAVAGECVRRVAAAMKEAMAAAPAGDALDGFRACGIAYVRFAVEHPAHFRVMNMPAVTARTPAEVRAESAAMMTTWRQDLVAAQAAGQINRDVGIDAILLAADCLVHGLAQRLVEGHEGLTGVTPAQATAMAETVTDVLGAGLSPR